MCRSIPRASSFVGSRVPAERTTVYPVVAREGHEAPAFGRLVRDTRVAMKSVPAGDRRAELRCDKRHLVAVVTDHDIVFETTFAYPLGTRQRIRFTCRRCGRSTPEYDLDPARLRGLLKANPTQLRLQVNFTDVASAVPWRFDSPTHRVEED